MSQVNGQRHFMSNRVYFLMVLGLAVGASLATAPAGVSGQVTAETATRLAEAAANEAFGAVDLVGVTPYVDPDMNVSAYAIEYARQEDGSAVTVIASARRDDVPIIMMWQGRPKHSDPDVLAAARCRIEESLGIIVSDPTAIFWLDIYQVKPLSCRSFRRNGKTASRMYSLKPRPPTAARASP
jgi:hypothetical protein